MSGLEHLQNLSIQPSNRVLSSNRPILNHNHNTHNWRPNEDQQETINLERKWEGSYSTVYSALDKYTNRTYAIKVLSKRHIVKENKIKYVNIEKTTLNRLGQQHPGLFNYIILSKMRVACFCFGFCRIWGVVVNH